MNRLNVLPEQLASNYTPSGRQELIGSLATSDVASEPGTYVEAAQSPKPTLRDRFSTHGLAALY